MATSKDFHAQPGDTWKNIAFNFGTRPAPIAGGAEVEAFNGVSCGKGHKTGAVKKEPAAA